MHTPFPESDRRTHVKPCVLQKTQSARCSIETRYSLKVNKLFRERGFGLQGRMCDDPSALLAYSSIAKRSINSCVTYYDVELPFESWCRSCI